MQRPGTGNLEVTVNCEVKSMHGMVIGRETHSLIFPVGNYQGLPDLEASINTIAETQKFCSSLGGQCTQTALWKAARHLEDERPKPDEISPDALIPPTDPAATEAVPE